MSVLALTNLSLRDYWAQFPFLSKSTNRCIQDAFLASLYQYAVFEVSDLHWSLVLCCRRDSMPRAARGMA
jgi:hypothetical protein